MTRLPFFVLDYYDREVVGHIIEKYGLEPLEAAQRFLTSKTHRMLEDQDYGLWEYPTRSVLEMWEAEQITGRPELAACVRAE